MDDISILREAYRRETDPKDRRADNFKNWEYYSVGASRDDIRRLLDEGLVSIVVKTSSMTRYKLTQKGKDVVWSANMEEKMESVPATSIMDAMSLIVGYEDIKATLATTIEAKRKVNFLLEGPPASLHGDTEVWVDLGAGPQALPIGDLEGKELKSLSIHPKCLKAGWYEAEVSSHEYEGEWVAITGRGVLPFPVTATHSLVAYDSGVGGLIPKLAGDLKTGDIIPVINRWRPWKYQTHIPIGKDLVPLDAEFGFMLGFWLGDGGLSQGKTKAVTFTNRKRKVLDRLKLYLKTLQGNTNYSGGYIDRTSLVLQHRELFDFLRREFLVGDGKPGIKGRSARRKRLPGWVLNGPDSFITQLIQGYFYADGTVSNGVISATSTSSMLCRDIAFLLNRLDIAPAIQRRGKDAQTIVIRQCDAESFIKQVGVFRENKVSTASLLHDESYKIPFPFNDQFATSLMAAIRKGRKSQSLTRRAALELLTKKWKEQLSELLDGDIRWVRVENIQKWTEPLQKVYDLSVPQAETFTLGNRVLVHNCAKSLLLEGVRSVTPKTYLAFGSRTSAAGLSDALFEYQPEILLMDEADKMHNDCYSVLLGLMESGEIIETKSQRTRGIKLRTMVIAACNSSEKMPREFKSRFALHVRFPEYTRDEFIDVCCGFLSRAESCPQDLATLIGELVFDNHIGDVRKARGVWMLMNEPTVDEVRRVVQLMIKYSPDSPETKLKKSQQITMKL